MGSDTTYLSSDSENGREERPPRVGFELTGAVVSLAAILPSRPIGDQVKRSPKYAAVLSSIREVGIIEPPVVRALNAGRKKKAGQYLLLDGHLRVEALKDLGRTEALCLLSTDDEAYTYNHQVNRLAPIQEHYMIMKALARGISEERIARVLDLDVARIRERRDLLRGICPDAVKLLKATPIAPQALRYLREVTPERQVEIAEMMNTANVYTGFYCQALIAATPKEQRISEPKPSSRRPAIGAADLARMQREMASLHRDLQAAEEDYGSNYLDLVLVRGYLKKIMGNERVMRFLSARQPEILEGFQQIADATGLEGESEGPD
jgi:ParB-like chromosome segregation protein Spo0J